MWLWITLALASDFTITCVNGCIAPVTPDATVDLWVRPDTDHDLVLQFSIDDPPEEGRVQTIRAGNPTQFTTLKDRGDLALTKGADGQWLHQLTVPAGEVGDDTFLVVIVEHNGHDKKREILHWQPFRLLTEEQAVRRQELPESKTNWELDIQPWALRAQSPALGALPRSANRATTWWSLAFEESAENLDLDGESTGVPGITVNVSTPWEAGAGEKIDESGIAEKFLDGLLSPNEHGVVFEDLGPWTELEPRKMSLRDGYSFKMEHFYVAVTMHTNASQTPLTARDIGKGGRKSYHAHETSADLRPPHHPRFWASYTERDFGRDPDLLSLLEAQIDDGSVPPGLGRVARNDGSGGIPTFHTGLLIQLDPWLPGRGDGVVQKGILAVEVNAARRGIGVPMTRGSAALSPVQKLGRKLLKKPSSVADEIDLDKPPEGYFTAQAYAKLETGSGALKLHRAMPLYGERGGIPLLGQEPEVLRMDLHRATFPLDAEHPLGAQDRGGAHVDSHNPAHITLAARLQPGALMQKGPVGGRQLPPSLTPVDVYAQWILKITLVMEVEDKVAATRQPLIMRNRELAPEVTFAEEKHGIMGWLADITGIGKLWLFAGFLFVVVLLIVGGLPGLLPIAKGASGLLRAIGGRRKPASPTDVNININVANPAPPHQEEEP